MVTARSFLSAILILTGGGVCFAEAPERETRFAEYLSNSKLVGKFTVDGAEKPPKTETYTIKSCEKLASPDLYKFVARIKYGNVDAEVPMHLTVLWSGNTPVITLDSMIIPTMGTFDARVLIDGKSNRYAGTWQHGEKGGHMFGKIVPIEDGDEETKPKDGEQ